VPCRPNGRTFTASNFHIKALRVQTRGMAVRTVDLIHTIFISDACASGPRGLTSGHLDFECDTCLMDDCVWTGFHIVRTVAANFPYLCFGRKSHNWSNTECHSDVLLKTSRRMQAGTVQSFSTQRKVRMESSHRSDGRCFGQMGVRTVYHVVRTAGREPNFLTCKLCRIFWKHSE
jgi:hypothetical protein